MTRLSQKIEERLYAQHVGTLMGKTWAIQNPPAEDEWPDLLANDGDQGFGLEVRELYPDEGVNGSSKRTAEVKRVKQLQKAADVYYQDNSTAVQVKICGAPGDPNKLSQDIAGSVASLSLWQHKKLYLDDGRWMYVRRLPDECGAYKKWVVLSDTVGWVGYVDPVMVQKVINIKSDNLPRYKSHLEKVSLLLVCDRALNSGKNFFANVKGLNTAGFEYVYLLSYPDQLIRMSINKISSPDIFNGVIDVCGREE